jgi:hypothetical protein
MDISELFSNITAAGIQAFIDGGQEENLFIEFKTVKGATFRSEDDKRNLARALSGFANSSGGIVVWGIDARQGKNGIDCAQAIVAVNPVGQLLARLNELTGQAVSPAVDGVQHRAIEISDTGGVVLTLIPESDRGPHMAKLGEDRYYKRSGDSFYKMEHFDIADMFGRRAHPALRLRLEWELQAPYPSDSSVSAPLLARIIVENHGRGLAQYPALTIGKPTWEAISWSGWQRESLHLPIVPAPEDWWLRYAGGADVVLYPEDEFEVCSIFFQLSTAQSAISDLVIPVWVVSADMPSLRQDLIVRREEIAEAAARQGWWFGE